MSEILWGLLYVLRRTNKLVYLVVLGGLLAILVAVLGYGYLTGELKN